MIKDVNKVIGRLVELSKNGYLTISYESKIISFDFHATEELTLEIRDDNTYRLYYFDESHACPFEIKFRISDIKDAIFYEIGEFERCPFTEVIVLIFHNGSELSCFEDCR